MGPSFYMKECLEPLRVPLNAVLICLRFYSSGTAIVFPTPYGGLRNEKTASRTCQSCFFNIFLG